MIFRVLRIAVPVCLVASLLGFVASGFADDDVLETISIESLTMSAAEMPTESFPGL